MGTITECPAATRAQTPEEAKQQRVEASPAYLRGRVERDEELPEVEVRGEEEGSEEEQLRAGVVLWLCRVRFSQRVHE